MARGDHPRLLWMVRPDQLRRRTIYSVTETVYISNGWRVAKPVSTYFFTINMNSGEQRLGTEAQSFAGATLFLGRLREGSHAVLTLTTPPFDPKHAHLFSYF